MKRKLYVAVWGMSLLTACSAPKTGAPEWFENAVKTSDHQLLYMAEQLKDVPDTACFPRSTKADGSYRLENAKDWTSGFYPGSMWLAYELSGDEALAKEARRYTDRLEDIQYYTDRHQHAHRVPVADRQATVGIRFEQHAASRLQRRLRLL